jgi:hypothetical protein
MSSDRARTQQQIFDSMHRELRSWNPSIPESPDRLDPILRILLQLYSHELARIDKRVTDLWEIATNSLIRSLNPECRRWPVPAYTVMRSDVTDPVVEIDRHTRFFYREEREGGQTYFFAPLKSQKLIDAHVRHVYLKVGDHIVDLRPSAAVGSKGAADLPLSPTTPGQVYIGTEFEGKPADTAGCAVFLKGDRAALKQMRWGRWQPSAASGQFYEDAGFCPGLTSTIENIVRPDSGDGDWGGLRTGSSLFGQLEDHYIVIPGSFASTWEMAPIDSDLASHTRRLGLETPADDDRLYWMRVDLPPGGSKKSLASPLELWFDTCVVVNLNELTLFKHTGGNRIIDMQIPENIENILEVGTVTDSGGRHYLPRHRLQLDQSAGTYVIQEQRDHMVLWFDFSGETSPPPDSLTVTYSVTAGTQANGIGVGKISDLYESHPGIETVVNLLPTTGAIPARSTQQIVDEVTARLRDRDRTLTFDEIIRWAGSFDPRIKSCQCRNGIERTDTGVRRCIIVSLDIDHDQFCSTDEIGLLRTRLSSFLKSRAPVNTHFQVETSEK